MLLKYTIKAEIVNKVLNSTVNILSYHEHVLGLPSDINLYGNEHLIASDHIYKMLGDNLQTYMDENNLTDSDIDINTYEIVSETAGTDIYFVNPEQANTFTMIPSVVAFMVEPEYVIPVPENFRVSKLEPTSLKWEFDLTEEEFGHYVIDVEGNIIATLPIGINYYIEAALKYNTNYTRLLIRYNKDGTSDSTAPLTAITGSPAEVDLGYKPGRLTPSDLIRYEEQEHTPVQESMSAFQSGIGDGLDLFISKFKDDEFYKKFNLLNYTTAKRRYNADVYPPVPVIITFIAKGEEATRHWQGSATLLLECSKIFLTTIKVAATAYGSMPIKWQVCALVSFEKVNEVYVEALEDVASNVF